MDCLDIFCHWLPREFCDQVQRRFGTLPHMLARALKMPVMCDLEARWRVMDQFPGYRQIPSLASPPIEALANGTQSTTAVIAAIANEVMGEIVSRHPDRFAGYVAALPLDQPAAAAAEAERAVLELGASGVQLFSNINGRPLDAPEFEELWATLARLGRPVWLHPAREMSVPDYPGEPYSKYEMWWTLGWPYETALAMHRLVFSGLFERYPDLPIITHHAGALIPMVAGRLGPGLEKYGTRTPAHLKEATASPLTELPLTAFKRFYADTATFGAAAPLACGLAFFGIDRIVFASDMPFDPEAGPGYIRGTLAALDELNLSAEDRQKILSGNVQRLLGHPTAASKPATV